jgi:hypothetical protein
VDGLGGCVEEAKGHVGEAWRIVETGFVLGKREKRYTRLEGMVEVIPNGVGIEIGRTLRAR